MQQLVLVIHILVTLSLIALVLVQHGKGADVGASFGSGAANTMFGSIGPASFLMKLTGILAAVFFASSIGLGYMSSHQKQANTFDFKSAAPISQPNTTTPAESKPVTLTPPTPKEVGSSKSKTQAASSSKNVKSSGDQSAD